MTILTRMNRQFHFPRPPVRVWKDRGPPWSSSSSRRSSSRRRCWSWWSWTFDETLYVSFFIQKKFFNYLELWNTYVTFFLFETKVSWLSKCLHVDTLDRRAHLEHRCLWFEFFPTEMYCICTSNLNFYIFE